MLLADKTRSRAHLLASSHASSSTSSIGIGLSLACNLILFFILYNAWTSPCSRSDKSTSWNAFVSQARSSVSESEVVDDATTGSMQHRFHLQQVSIDEQQQQQGLRQRSSEEAIASPPTRHLLQSASSALGRLWLPPEASPLLAIKKDLSLDPAFQLSQHEITWNYCAVGGPGDTIIPHQIAYCDQVPEVEQKYQMSWFGTHVVPGIKRPFPRYSECINLPPADYKWPVKHTTLPAETDAVHWPNLRVHTKEGLVIFNRATPKNLFHFDAPKYDLDALQEMDWAAKYIPFGPKVRLMLDVGAGGGSLGILLKRKYDVQVLSTVFADWPYCEYIMERGGLCMLVDVMEPMPFAKFSFDVLHVSWVYHGQQPEELLIMYNELNRLIRPGGYLWMRGGWSQRQVDTLLGLLIEKLGYQVLIQEVKHKQPEVTARVSYGPHLPYDLDWSVVFVKPIAATRTTPCSPLPPQPLPNITETSTTG